jgi:hypothetical protein
MRGQSSYSRRVYVCSTRSQHRGDCNQSSVRADEIEAQVLEVIRSLPILEDWEAQAWNWISLGQDHEEMLEKERAIQLRGNGRWSFAWLGTSRASGLSRKRWLATIVSRPCGQGNSRL